MQTVQHVIDHRDGRPKYAKEFKACIQWKTNQPPSFFQKKNMPVLKNLWNRAKHLPSPQELKWTESDESNLVKLKDGDISDVSDTVLFKKAFSRKCNFIYRQGMFLESNERRQIIALLYQSLPTTEKMTFDADKYSIDSGIGFEETCLNYDENSESCNSGLALWVNKILNSTVSPISLDLTEPFVCDEDDDDEEEEEEEEEEEDEDEDEDTSVEEEDEGSSVGEEDEDSSVEE